MAVTVPLVTTFDSKGLRLAEKRFGEFQRETAKIGSTIKNAFLPAAAAVAGLGVAAAGAARAAIEDQQSAALLERQLQATTKATDAQVKANEDYITSLSLATGVADDELRPAQARILRSTKDLTKAQKLLTLSVDVAKGSGKSLQQVSEAISRAYGGNVKALARLDPSLKSFITKTTTADQAVAQLAKNFEGAAAKNAETFAGRMDRLKVAMGEAYESIGYALLPIVQKLADVFVQKVVPYVQKAVNALEEQGLSGAVRLVTSDITNFVLKADGWTGTIIDFTGAIVALGIAVKGLTLINSVATAFTALSGVLTALGTAILPGLEVSAGVVAGIFASILATGAALIGLFRDETARPAFLEFLANSAKLIANGFIAAYNAAALLINLPIQAANLLPGVNASTVPLLDFYDFTFDTGTTAQRNRALAGMSDSAQIQINVSGAIDPISTGKQIADILARVDRRGISPTRGM